MRKIQSVLCAAALAISLSSTVLAGNIHTASAPVSGALGNIHTAPGDISGAPGDIHTAPGDIHGIYGILITEVLVSIFGNIHV